MHNTVHVIGAGLAGCEAAYQAAQLGLDVIVYEMKPQVKSPAHHLDSFAELVCSNSLRAKSTENAAGLLKEEMRRLDGLLIRIADACQIPAGGALAVDRESFSSQVTEAIRNHPRIEIREEQIEKLPDDGIWIVATGPLTEGALFQNILDTVGMNGLHFFDAAAPIVFKDSLDMNKVFAQSRYGKGGDDYLNCPMNAEEYDVFYKALTEAELAAVKDFDREIVFEGCMPVESMAKRGYDTLRFGPLKPVGLVDPNTGKQPFACIQLRQDNRIGSLYNLVGFQTRLNFAEQKRVFSLIPGLEQVEFARMGVMHRNTYLNSPGVLGPDYSVKSRPNLFFAGQITGVEGYVESMASGLLAGINAALRAREIDPLILNSKTMMGAMAHYVSDPLVRNFQPMNANMGLLTPLEERVKKPFRAEKRANRALQSIEESIVNFNTIKERLRECK